MCVGLSKACGVWPYANCYVVSVVLGKSIFQDTGMLVVLIWEKHVTIQKKHVTVQGIDPVSVAVSKWLLEKHVLVLLKLKV